MPDTRREKAALQTLHADNTAGDISAQDNRDGWETCHPSTVVQTAAFASEPAAGQITGDLFLPNNGFYVERYSGSAWVPWGPIFPMTKPVSGDFAWINQGSATVATTNGGVVLDCVSNGGAYGFRIRKKTAPATPYTITACFMAAFVTGGLGFAGLVFRQSSDGKLHGFEIGVDATASTVYVNSRKMTDPSTYSADYVNAQTARLTHPGPIWIRIADNGTNRICSHSADGQNFVQFHTIGRTDFLTADEVGFYINPYGAQNTMTLLSWAQA